MARESRKKHTETIIKKVQTASASESGQDKPASSLASRKGKAGLVKAGNSKLADDPFNFDEAVEFSAPAVAPVMKSKAKAKQQNKREQPQTVKTAMAKQTKSKSAASVADSAPLALPVLASTVDSPRKPTHSPKPQPAGLRTPLKMLSPNVSSTPKGTPTPRKSLLLLTPSKKSERDLSISASAQKSLVDADKLDSVDHDDDPFGFENMQDVTSQSVSVALDMSTVSKTQGFEEKPSASRSLMQSTPSSPKIAPVKAKRTFADFKVEDDTVEQPRKKPQKKRDIETKDSAREEERRQQEYFAKLDALPLICDDEDDW